MLVTLDYPITCYSNSTIWNYPNDDCIIMPRQDAKLFIHTNEIRKPIGMNIEIEKKWF